MAACSVKNQGKAPIFVISQGISESNHLSAKSYYTLSDSVSRDSQPSRKKQDFSKKLHQSFEAPKLEFDDSLPATKKYTFNIDNFQHAKNVNKQSITEEIQVETGDNIVLRGEDNPLRYSGDLKQTAL